MTDERIPSNGEVLTKVAKTLGNMIDTLEEEGNPLPRDVKHTLAVSILLILTVADAIEGKQSCDCPECRRQEASLN